MPNAVNETMNHVHEPTEDESFRRIDEEQIDLEEDGMETNTNDSDTWSNHEHENDNIFSDNDEINSSPSPTMETASPSVPEVMHIGSSDAAAGRNRGRNVARRGRRGPHPRTPFPLYGNTPFGRGLTFNGFAKNLELEKILDCTVYSIDTLLFLVQWRNDGNRVRIIESSLLRTYSPQMLMDFYEKKMVEYYRS
ncbi:hypothetical protein AGLY_008769 [Aphis glycines]|uniref:Chromo domain-containing protein n=1 Tax=Aphis glycines TaxID=307491 RepID=A0A6G0TJJ2_APHGL|nr:hypothetical protein AGLY_008769 [Aphis glycines]